MTASPSPSIKAINEKIAAMETSFVNATDDLAAIRDDTNGLRGDIDEIRNENTKSQNSIHQLSEDLRALRRDLQLLTEAQDVNQSCFVPSVCRIKDAAYGGMTRSCIHSELRNLKDENLALRNQLGEIWKKLAELPDQSNNTRVTRPPTREPTHPSPPGKPMPQPTVIVNRDNRKTKHKESFGMGI